jgi:hypothetical protein
MSTSFWGALLQGLKRAGRRAQTPQGISSALRAVGQGIAGFAQQPQPGPVVSGATVPSPPTPTTPFGVMPRGGILRINDQPSSERARLRRYYLGEE